MWYVLLQMCDIGSIEDLLIQEHEGEFFRLRTFLKFSNGVRTVVAIVSKCASYCVYTSVSQQYPYKDFLIVYIQGCDPRYFYKVGKH